MSPVAQKSFTFTRLLTSQLINYVLVFFLPTPALHCLLGLARSGKSVSTTQFATSLLLNFRRLDLLLSFQLAC